MNGSGLNDGWEENAQLTGGKKLVKKRMIIKMPLFYRKLVRGEIFSRGW